MNISKECYDCGINCSVSEQEVEDGLTRRDENLVWICPECRDSDGDIEEVDP